MPASCSTDAGGGNIRTYAICQQTGGVDRPRPGPREGARRRRAGRTFMAISADWKQRTVGRLALELGVLAGLIVDDVLAALGMTDDGEIQPRQFMTFLSHLHRELPATIDKESLIQQLANELLTSASNGPASRV